MLVESIAALVKDKKIEGLSDIDDHSSDRVGIRLEIFLKRDANPQVVLNQLFKYTKLQDSLSINMLAIKDGRPKTMGLKEILDQYIIFQKKIVTRRTKYDLTKAEARMHILEGLIKALSVLDELIKVIRASKNKSDAKINIINKFGFTEAQAEAIVTLQLYKLTNTDVVELQNRHAELKDLIEYSNKILAEERELLGVIKQELRSIKKEFATPRLTEIKDEITEIKIDEMAMVNKDDYIVTLTKDGYIKRTSFRSYTSSNPEDIILKENDYIIGLYEMNTLDTLLVFTSGGNYIYLPVFELTENKWKDEGTHINNISSYDGKEKIISVICVKKFRDDLYVALAASNGTIKRTVLSDFVVSRYSKALSCMKISDKEKEYIISLYKRSHVSIRKFVRFYGKRSYSCIYNVLKEADMIHKNKK